MQCRFVICCLDNNVSLNSLISLLISESCAFQDTVVALEALSTFSIQNNELEDLDLGLEICVNNKRKEHLYLNRQTALTQKAIEVREVSIGLFNVFIIYLISVSIWDM